MVHRAHGVLALQLLFVHMGHPVAQCPCWPTGKFKLRVHYNAPAVVRLQTANEPCSNALLKDILLWETLVASIGHVLCHSIGCDVNAAACKHDRVLKRSYLPSLTGQMPVCTLIGLRNAASSSTVESGGA